MNIDSNNIPRINRKINAILKQEKLDKEQNIFFTSAGLCENISLDDAIQIAFNWRLITKQFLYTTIRGLSPFVDKVLGMQAEPDEGLLKVLQTSFYVISDDLNSVHPIFKKVAPKGPKGIHYKWWEESILNKLTSLSTFKPSLQDGVNQLLLKMHEISSSPFGTPVQLRIVEAIALDICLAFYSIFSNVEYNQECIFKDENDKVWITSHIQAEMIHNHQVCDETSGMAHVVITPEDEEIVLKLAQEYAKAWADALTTLANCFPH